MKKPLLAILLGLVLIVALDFLLGLLPLPGNSSAAGDPYLGFSSLSSVFERYRADDGSERYRTRQAMQQWFNRQDFPANKPSGVRRFFTLGGSTTYGRPYRNQTSFSGWLQRMLDISPGAGRFEVINAGGISYASYRVKIVLEEVLGYDPDLIVIYTGHNEFLESRTYPQFEHGPSTGYRVTSLLRSTNTYRVLQPLLEPVARLRRGEKPAAQSPGVLGPEVETLLDQSAGLDMYHRDTVYADRVFEHFRYNVSSMIELCREAGVPVVFCDPVDNLKDFSPFKSSVNPQLSSQGRRQLDNLLDRGRSALDSGDTSGAIGAFSQAAALDSLYALSHFLLGRSLLAAGDTSRAADELLAARELDVCPLRAQQPVHRALKEVTDSAGIGLLDLRALLAERSPGGLIGKEWLIDHIHPGPEGNLLFAGRIYGWISGRFPGWHLDTASLPDADSLLADGLAGLGPDYFENGVLNLAKVLVWAGKYTEVNSLLGGHAELLKQNGEARYLMGFVKEKLGEYEAAVRFYAGALELMPRHRNSMNFLAGLYTKHGYYDEAGKIYRHALEMYPDDPQLLSNYGILLANTGKLDEAERSFLRSHELNPSNAMVLNNLGLLALRRQDTGRALEYFSQSLEVAPGNPQANNLSGLALMMNGEFPKAEQHFLAALDASPEDPSIRTNLGNLYRKAGKLQAAAEQFRLALALDNDHPDYYRNLALILRELGQDKLSAEIVRRGLEKFPDNENLKKTAGSGPTGSK